MGKSIALIHIWRAEASDEPEAKHNKDPFDGIETYVVADEDVAWVVVNRLSNEHPGWKFMIETPPDWSLEPL